MKKSKLYAGILLLGVCLAFHPGFAVSAADMESMAFTELVSAAAAEAAESVSAAAAKATESVSAAAAGTTEPAFAAAATTVKSTAAVKNGLVKEANGKYCCYKKGTKLKNKWKTINGKRYYFNSRGYASTGSVKIKGVRYIFNSKGQLQKPAKDTVVKVGSTWYYVGKGGKVEKGWHILNNKLYYSRSTGVVRTSTTWQGITFNRKGYAVDNTASRLKMKTMEVVASITNESMTAGQKLYACWSYVTGGSLNYAGRWPNLSKSGWQKETALNMLTTKYGNCYSYACAFAALASEIGYEPKVICGRVTCVGGSRDNVGDGYTPHCWVMINGLYYDPEAQYAGWYPGVYGLGTYSVGHKVQQTIDFNTY